MQKKNRSKFAQIFDPHMWFYDFVKITGSIIFPFYRHRKIYLEKTKDLLRGPFIICANHLSTNDPLILLSSLQSRRLSFLACKEMFKNKFLTWMYKSFGCIKIDRQNPSLQTFKEAKKKLDWGHVVVVFPEQRINTTGQLLDFKKGIVMIAVMSNVPILPIYIVKRQNKKQKKYIVIGKKLDWKQYCAGAIPTVDEMEHICQVLKEKELELKLKYEETINK